MWSRSSQPNRHVPPRFLAEQDLLSEIIPYCLRGTSQGPNRVRDTHMTSCMCSDSQLHSKEHWQIRISYSRRSNLAAVGDGTHGSSTSQADAKGDAERKYLIARPITGTWVAQEHRVDGRTTLNGRTRND
ncbi:hypothetical protein BJY52DRAFT_1221913 [Lactarius psammicola]|nr:hypothetical protein BJY52DRAFT_1221913 [Lactarius psammicola]